MTAARYIVREGTERGEGAWITSDENGRWQEVHQQRGAWYFDSHAEAAPVAQEVGGRVVRLLSREESCQRAIAAALLRIAFPFVTKHPAAKRFAAEDIGALLEVEAMKLWPTKIRDGVRVLA